ncbi:MAG: 5'-methylthioadenosine/adenosylhomocysteine nucleosidase [Clostridiales bacterium]|nr:5'-methylthioadenosine/adenosylhomocysteine nucleosidase [Clostridiales bacterium]
MPIGVLCAMTEEIALLRGEMEITERETVGGREFLTGRLYGRETVLARSGIGKAAAASTVTTLLDRFGAELVIFSGTAGGADPALHTGDLVVSDRSVQHDMDAIGEALFQVPGHEGSWFGADPRLTALAADAAQRFFERDMAQELSPGQLVRFGITRPQVAVGTVASGDQFISSREKIRWLGERIENLKCVEMEGAAAAQICVEFGVPHVILRVISDGANEDSPVDFDAFVTDAARYFTRGVVRELIRSL